MAGATGSWTTNTYGQQLRGPVPTPNPPRTVSYTPQQSGGTVNTYAGPAYSNKYVYQPSVLGVTSKPAVSSISTTTNTGGGGGGGTPTPSYNVPQAGVPNQEPPMPDFTQQINDIYGGLNDQFNTWESQVRGGEQNLYDSFTQPYEAQRPDIENAYKQGLQLNDSSRNSTQQQFANALDAARQTFGELQQGVKARFGGSNSAGDFAKQFYGRELQRQLGNNQNQLGQNINSIDMQKTQISNDYNTNLQKLEMAKTGALLQAKQAFQAQLDAINQGRIQVGQNKAAAQLQALQDYRNNMWQVQQQATAHAQQLQTQALAGLQNLTQATAQAQAYAKTPVNMGAYQAPYYSLLQNLQQSNPGLPNVVGSLGPQKKEQYGYPTQ